MGKSNITYLDWNITCVEGCTPISAGCQNCYAQEYLTRFKKPTGIVLHPDRLEKDMKSLARIKERQVVGIAFTGDLFHSDVLDEFITDIWQWMATCPQHTFLVLTKRPDRMADVVATIRSIKTSNEWFHKSEKVPWPLPNVWLGVSVEDQKTADERIPILLSIPAAHHWLSIEPMLEAIALESGSVGYLTGWETQADHSPRCDPDEGCDGDCPVPTQVQTNALCWVVLGCESGKDRRPFEEDWARGVRDLCSDAGIDFMYKQGIQGGKLVHLPELDGVVHDGRPE